MKNLKAKLLTSVVMLLIAAIAMSTASYAWFSISTAPEIKEITTSVTANGNLEIALAGETAATAVPDSAVGDSGTDTTWGNIIASTLALGTLKPVKFTAGDSAVTIQGPVYGTDGRITSLTDASSAYSGGITTYTGGEGIAYAVNFWLRTNVAGDISMTADVTGDGESLINTALYCDGKKIADKITVAASGGTYNINTPIQCELYVYLDGPNIKNADLLNDAQNATLNVKFAHSATLNPMSNIGDSSTD